jgi:hypothetical protein
VDAQQVEHERSDHQERVGLVAAQRTVRALDELAHVERRLFPPDRDKPRGRAPVGKAIDDHVVLGLEVAAASIGEENSSRWRCSTCLSTCGHVDPAQEADDVAGDEIERVATREAPSIARRSAGVNGLDPGPVAFGARSSGIVVGVGSAAAGDGDDVTAVMATCCSQRAVGKNSRHSSMSSSVMRV